MTGFQIAELVCAGIIFVAGGAFGIYMIVDAIRYVLKEENNDG